MFAVMPLACGAMPLVAASFVRSCLIPFSKKHSQKKGLNAPVRRLAMIHHPAIAKKRPRPLEDNIRKSKWLRRFQRIAPSLLYRLLLAYFIRNETTASRLVSSFALMP